MQPRSQHAAPSSTPQLTDWGGLGMAAVGVVLGGLAFVQGSGLGVVALGGAILLALLWVVRLWGSPAPSQAMPPPSFSTSAIQPPYMQQSYMQQPSLYTRQPPMAMPPASPPPDPQWLENDPFFSALERPDPAQHPGLRCFITHKRDADGMVECEDSYALNLGKHRFAVADGVGGSELPRPWARLLALTFVTQPTTFFDRGIFGERIVQLGHDWRQWVRDTWYATLFPQRPPDADSEFQRRLNNGAQATLAGCELHLHGQQRDQLAAHVVAVGDADFLLFRPTSTAPWELIAAFPLDRPEQFGVNPQTLLTNPRYAAQSTEWLREQDFPLQAGDLIVLGTDSIAKWLLDQVRENGEQWRPLLACQSQAEFEQRIAAARTDMPGFTRLEDDDVTLLLIPVPVLQERNAR